MELQEKLQVLTEAARYDVSCSTSGVERHAAKGQTGNTLACGICHSWSDDGRCVSLLKLLMTNACVYDCAYCANRKSANIRRATLSPDEIVNLTMSFYRRNYIEGLFLSSAIVHSADWTMEHMVTIARTLREKERFNGYIHMKAIPGASKQLLLAAGLYADRLSVNIELPTTKSLQLLAPDKSNTEIQLGMHRIAGNILQSKEERALFKGAPQFAPAGQTTQMIVGASPESDKSILTLTEGLYRQYRMKRVYYSAYTPVSNHPALPQGQKPPLLREHRLYQADWLLRFYGFEAKELLDDSHPNLDPRYDPKCDWALRHFDFFPVEVNKANEDLLLRVPGIGVRSAKRILQARRVGPLDFEGLRRLGVVLKRARFFITCKGKTLGNLSLDPDWLGMALASEAPVTNTSLLTWQQLPLISPPSRSLLTAAESSAAYEVAGTALTGEI